MYHLSQINHLSAKFDDQIEGSSVDFDENELIKPICYNFSNLCKVGRR